MSFHDYENSNKKELMEQAAIDNYGMSINHILSTLEMVEYGVQPEFTKLGKELSKKLHD